MSIKGIEMVSVHEDVIDGETYLKILEERILPLMNRYPKEGHLELSDKYASNLSSSSGSCVGGLKRRRSVVTTERLANVSLTK